MSVLKKIIVIMTVMLMLPISADKAFAVETAEPVTADIYYDYESEHSILVKPVSESSVRIIWEAAEGAGSYALTYSSETGGRKVKYVKNGKTYCKISGLKKGGSYSFRLYARMRDSSGKLGYVCIADSITIALCPDAPENFQVGKYSMNKAVLEWTAVDSCTGYELERLKGDTWKRIAVYDDPRTVSCSLGGLTSGTQYSFRIRAFSGSDKVMTYSDYLYTSVTTDTEEYPESVSVSGANMVYVGESFGFKREYSDGADYPEHEVLWSVDSGAARIDQSGRLTAVSKGDVYVSYTDKTAHISGSMLVHCVESAADVDFVPMIFGIPIANKTYPLPADYDPGMNEEALSAFNVMARDAAKEGMNLFIISSYRSYSRQKELYSYWTNRFGSDTAERVSARAGYSEHQLGLAIDVNSCYYTFLDTPESGWLAANCHKYGFILRYPSHETESITGYAYEPWHIRYLGKELALSVHNSGLTLEEYLGIDSYYRK